MTTDPDGGARKLRVAVIGCGPIGDLHARAIAGAGCAALVAVCDTDPARAASAAERWRAAAYGDARQLLAGERLDAVTIATPDHLHVEPALQAIDAGCHVFCEKPLAAGAAEARRVVQAAAEHGVRLAVDYNRRFAFGYCTARRHLDEGSIGRLETCLVRVTDPVPPPAVARHPHVILTTLLTHHLDLLRWLGGEIRRVYATTGSQPDGPLVQNVCLSLDFAGGAIGTIVAGYRSGQSRTAEWMELSGSAGSLVVEDVTRRVILTGADPDRRQVFEPSPFAAAGAFYDSLVEHVQTFLAHVARGAAPPVTGRDGLASLLLAEAAIESLQTGQRVEVPIP